MELSSLNFVMGSEMKKKILRLMVIRLGYLDYSLGYISIYLPYICSFKRGNKPW